MSHSLPALGGVRAGDRTRLTPVHDRGWRRGYGRTPGPEWLPRPHGHKLPGIYLKHTDRVTERSPAMAQGEQPTPMDTEETAALPGP